MMKISLSKGQVAIVDDAEFEKVSAFDWCAKYVPCTKSFYAVRNESIVIGGVKKRRTMSLHRFIMGLKYGDKRQVDHQNHDTLDNRRANLRVCTHVENARNVRMHSNNSSGYRGVTWNRDRKKWLAQAQLNSKQRYLGLFDTKEKASRAYEEFTDKHHGEFKYRKR